MPPLTAPTRPTSDPARLANPVVQAFLILRVGFTLAPILFGLDKFVEVTADWSTYLWSGVADAVPGSADQIMLGVGAIEIAAGILVAVRPRIGGYVVAAWLAGIIVNLLLVGEFLDIALRDFGLFLGALSLARLATLFGGTSAPEAVRQ
ncbi:MAG: hypothetical protein KY469_11330 [Actinobacteria bacterium]|nr:hypothetical protein [Actinomycetota bacterium]